MDYTVVDPQGFRLSIGIILVNTDNKLFWARRIGKNIWQFPQGGIAKNETTEEALFRELREEVGLLKQDVKIVDKSKLWVQYLLPAKYIRNDTKPLVIGQRQKWYLLELFCSDKKIQLNNSNHPEFDAWMWADYWYPIENIVFFKKKIYKQVLQEFEYKIFTEHNHKSND